GVSRRIHHRHQRPGLLLRSAESVATGNEREHEPPPTPILPERHDALRVLAGRPQPRGAATQSTPSEDARLSFTCGSLRGTRCVDGLSPRRLSSRWRPDEGDRADNEGFRPSPLPSVCRVRLPARYSSGSYRAAEGRGTLRGAARASLPPSKHASITATPGTTTSIREGADRRAKSKSSVRLDRRGASIPTTGAPLP